MLAKAKALAKQLWPSEPGEESRSTKRRVALSVGLLVSAKLINIQVPFFFKNIVDSLSVTLPEEDRVRLELPNIQAPMPTRDMTNAPEYLYNLYLSYDAPWGEGNWGSQLTVFYSVQGDTLIAGAGEADGNFVPNVYAEEFGTLNVSVDQALGEWFRLRFQAKNLTNPDINTVYRSPYIGPDVLKTSFTRGIDYSLSLGAEVRF